VIAIEPVVEPAPDAAAQGNTRSFGRNRYSPIRKHMDDVIGMHVP
jgi:hypothetical protein